MIWRRFALAASGAFIFGLVMACGGGEDSEGGGSETLTAGDVMFQVDFRGAEPTDLPVRPDIEVEEAPAGTNWWGFELQVENTGSVAAQTPDVAVICGNETVADADFVDDTGFIEGEAPYAGGDGAGGRLDPEVSNTGVVPLPVPEDATSCTFLVKMSSEHGDHPPLEFSFDASQ